jgi:phosphomannomutase
MSLDGARSLDPTILREYDIRGIVGQSLTVEDVFVIGRAFGTMVAESGGSTVAVGYDGRLSSPDLETAVIDGLTASGLKVFRVGRGPTPMLYFATYHLEASAGLMITGSHNPPEYNGIKMSIGGKAFYGDAIQRLGVIAAAGKFVEGAGASVVDRPVFDAYVDRLCAAYEEGDGPAVVWDPGNGAAGDVVAALCQRLPGHHAAINCEIDGTFPSHHPDPTVEANLEQLKVAVIGEGRELGVAFDGDGDRIGVVDSQGRVLWGDQLLLVLAGDVLAANPGATIIADVKASQVLFDEIERLGGKALMWRTGHSLIKAKMAETGAPLAGEMSGHIFFGAPYYGFDDALYAAIRLLSVVMRDGRGLDAIRDAMPQTVNTPELRFDCAEDRKFEVVEEVRHRLEDAVGVTVHDIDGVRVQSEDGWWLLRASNTQAVLVARCEAADEAGLDRLKAALSDALRASGIEPPAFD